MIPDLIDVIYSTLKQIYLRKRIDEFPHHSWPTHFPLLYTPFILLAIFIPTILTGSIAINIYLHFFGDTFYTDDGIRWFWPFVKNKKVKFLSKSMKGQHDKLWIISYRKTPLYKIEWCLFIITSILIIFNAFILYGVILFIIAIICMVSLIIFIYFFERRMTKSGKNKIK